MLEAASLTVRLCDCDCLRLCLCPCHPPSSDICICIVPSSQPSLCSTLSSHDACTAWAPCFRLTSSSARLPSSSTSEPPVPSPDAVAASTRHDNAIPDPAPPRAGPSIARDSRGSHRLAMLALFLWGVTGTLARAARAAVRCNVRVRWKALQEATARYAIRWKFITYALTPSSAFARAAVQITDVGRCAQNVRR